MVLIYIFVVWLFCFWFLLSIKYNCCLIYVVLRNKLCNRNFLVCKLCIVYDCKIEDCV